MKPKHANVNKLRKCSHSQANRFTFASIWFTFRLLMGVQACRCSAHGQAGDTQESTRGGRGPRSPLHEGAPSLRDNRCNGGADIEVVEVNCRDGGRLTYTRSTPEQTGARAIAHVVSKQVLIVLVRNVFNVTCQDASRIYSSVDRNLPEGLRTNTASHC